MKLIFRPIFIIFFVILVLNFATSMNKKLAKHQNNDLALDLIKKQQEKLLQEQEKLIYQAAQLDDPFLQEKLLRDQRWLKKSDEETLSLSGYQYSQRAWQAPVSPTPTPAQAWQQLLLQALPNYVPAKKTTSSQLAY